MRALALAAVASLLAPACAYYSQEDGERLANEVYALQTQVTAMQQAVSQLQTDEKQQKVLLAKMTEEVGTLSKAARRNDADLGVQLDEMMQDVARMRGRVETFSERVSALEQSASKVQEEVDLRFQGLAEKRQIDAANSEEEKQKAIDQARERERLLQDPKTALNEAEAMLKSKPVEARKLLRELDIRYKNDNAYSKKYGAKNQYLIGETYFAEGNYQQAAAVYNTVRKKHPRSKLVPEALYRLGECFEKLNLPEDAKLFYQTVKQKYSRSAAAKKAKKRLAELK